LRRATADTAQRLLGGIDVGPLVSAVEEGSPVTTGRARLGQGRSRGAARPAGAGCHRRAPRRDDDGERAAAAELALEALYLAKRIDKVSGDGETVYG